MKTRSKFQLWGVVGCGIFGLCMLLGMANSRTQIPKHFQPTTTEANNEGIQFVELGYEAALKLAKESKKPVFIDCYTVWCGPCKILSAKTFTDKEVGEFFNANFVNIKVEMERDKDAPELARLFDVRAYPTLLFVNKQGKLIKKSLGYVSPSQLIAIAKETLK